MACYWIIFSCFWSCQDFSKFDCFNEPNGCGILPNLDAGLILYDQQINEPTDMQIVDQTVLDLEFDMGVIDMEVDRGIEQDMYSLDMEIDMNIPSMDMDVLDMELPDHCQELEVCDQLDNDCDGNSDEELLPHLYSPSFSRLTEIDSNCDDDDDSSSEHCQIASHTFCQQKQCNQVGLGIIEISEVNEQIIASLACLPASYTQHVTVDYPTLKMWDNDCDSQRDLRRIECRFAFDRYCAVNLNGTAGLGPLSSTNMTAEFTCVSNVVKFTRTYDTLTEINEDCNTSEQFGAECNQAIHQYCTNLNDEYITGWGPLSFSDSTLDFVCLKKRPTPQ